MASAKQIKALDEEKTLPRHYWHKHRVSGIRTVFKSALKRLVHSKADSRKKQFDDLKF